MHLRRQRLRLYHRFCKPGNLCNGSLYAEISDIYRVMPSLFNVQWTASPYVRRSGNCIASPTRRAYSRRIYTSGLSIAAYFAREYAVEVCEARRIAGSVFCIEELAIVWILRTHEETRSRCDGRLGMPCVERGAADVGGRCEYAR